MSRKKRAPRRSPKRNPKRGGSLSWLMITFVLAVLINAGLMTSSSYMLLLRMGLMKPLMRTTLWPMFLVLLCILFANYITVDNAI